MIAVLDASAAVGLALKPDSEFRRFLALSDLVIAPDLINAEVCSALFKYVKAGLMSRSQAERSIMEALALVDEMKPMGDLVTEAIDLVSNTKSSPYDAFYLALAKRTGAVLLTADTRLRNAAVSIGVATS